MRDENNVSPETQHAVREYLKDRRPCGGDAFIKPAGVRGEGCEQCLRSVRNGGLCGPVEVLPDGE